jgi:branched-chain amino acid transport system permease protein
MQELAQNLINALSLGGLYALIALGVTIVYTIMGMMNFAHGELITLGAYAMFAVGGAPFGVAIIAALLTSALAAVLLERVAFRPIRSADLSTQLVTSLAVAVILQSTILLAATSRPRAVTTPAVLGEPTSFAGLQIPYLEIITLVVTGVLLVALGAFLHRTRMGTAMRAAAENFDMARLMGVRANVVIGSAFAISGLLAGIVAVLLVAQTGTISPAMGLAPILIGFVAVVIGGFGRISGAVVGGLVLGMLASLLQAYLPDDVKPYRDAIVFSVPIVILLFCPYGLLRGNIARARV